MWSAIEAVDGTPLSPIEELAEARDKIKVSERFGKEWSILRGFVSWASAHAEYLRRRQTENVIANGLEKLLNAVPEPHRVTSESTHDEVLSVSGHAGGWVKVGGCCG